MSLSVIHLSDIHIKDASDLILTRTNPLKAACVSSLPSNGVVVIVISGDIAFSGKEEEYKLAHDLINDLISYIIEQKNSDVHVVCVPGNHDCNFSSGSTVRSSLIRDVKSQTIDHEFYSTVNNVQQSFQEFAELYGIDSTMVLPRVEISDGDSTFLFLLANTAWMSVLHETYGNIIIPNYLYEPVSHKKYTAVFYVFHHPLNWLNPDFKREFITHIRQNADIVLMGHEHTRDMYSHSGDSFNVFCSHGKELQDRDSDSSAFTVLNFDSSFQNFEIIDFAWSSHSYERVISKTMPFTKNTASLRRVSQPNAEALEKANDLGVVVTHFAKEDVSLHDLFTWPDLSQNNFCDEKAASVMIRTNTLEELNSSNLNIFVGNSCSGKTAIANMLFLCEESSSSCCILLNGTVFTTADECRIREVIENTYSAQYSPECLEEFRQLPKDHRSIIIDDFDLIRNVKSRRSNILDYVCSYFGRVTILLSSSIELTSLLASKTLGGKEKIIYYEIMPFGNRKRKEMISKWYRLNTNSLSDDDISDRIDSAINKINIFLGNGNGFVPAVPVFIISALQNLDAIQQSYAGSKYGFLYESLITSSLTKISPSYANAGSYNVDIGVLSALAYNMLLEKRTSFTLQQLQAVISDIEGKKLLIISADALLDRMERAKIICQDPSSGNVYRFFYPYIFYYFCGRYIAYHLDEKDIQHEIEYMSSKLYVETYGNIIIFLCHFANNSDVIDTVLLNAYDTLVNYEEFDFDKGNPIFNEIKGAVESLVPKTIAASDKDVNDNKNKRLDTMDNMGINDGHIVSHEDFIDDEISEAEKDMASVVAALKTIDVLGEILQNYPLIEGDRKIEIIREIHHLGMRSVQALICTMGYIEKELIDFYYDRVQAERRSMSREQAAIAARRLINFLISGMASGMVHHIAKALNSDTLLPAATKSFEIDKTISSKLILLDLKLNCLNSFSITEVQKLKKDLDSANEKFASRILVSIVAHYLNYNRCNQGLRSKLCDLCGLSKQQTLIQNTRNLLG